MIDPRRVYNADETMMKLNSSSDTVLAPKGTKNLFNVSKDDKAGLTVMATFRADGASLKPFIVYPYERVPKNLTSTFPHDQATLAATSSGWMQSETFCIYLRSLAQEIVQSGVQFPVLLFVDNHSSHTSLNACETAKELNIELVFLYPNSTHILQPADVAVLRCLKSLWKEENRVSKRNDITITKLNFAEVFLRAFVKIPSATIKTGFFKCGLVPLDSSNVDYTKCIGKNSTDSLDENENFATLDVQEDFTNETQEMMEIETLNTTLEVNRDCLEIALQHPVLFFSQQFEAESHLVGELIVEELCDSNDGDLRSYDDIINEQNQEMMDVEPIVIFNEPVLKLPPTPKRQGKRNVRRTHPFSSQNIAKMQESQTKKAREDEEKKNRKAARAQKKNEMINKKIENAKVKMAKTSKILETLTQQRNT